MSAISAPPATATAARYQTTQTANYTVDFANGPHQTVFGNTNAFTVTLPTAVGQAGQTVRIVKIGSDTNAITLATTSSQTIGAHASGVIKLYKQDDFIEVESDGANWKIVSEKVTIEAHVSRITTDQTVTTGVDTKIQYNGKAYDTAGAFDSTTNYRFTAPRAGRYRYAILGTLDAPNGLRMWFKLFKNGATTTYVTTSIPTAGNTQSLAFSGDIVLANGDYLEVYGQTNRGSDDKFNKADGTSDWNHFDVAYEGN